MKSVFVAFWLSFFVVSAPASATECAGNNLINALPKSDQAWIRKQTADVLYHEGLLWTARRGDAYVTLIGTYHFNHPAHAGLINKVAMALDEADLLLVEMGPAEERRFKKALMTDPSISMELTGPTLSERLEADEWKLVRDAMEARGIPAGVATRMQPWYVAMLLSVSPCIIKQKEHGQGLDHRLMARAEAARVPVKALEPWDTALKMFRDLTPAEEIDMITYTLPTAMYADDYTTTMNEAYQAQDVWPVWEFGRLDAYRNSGLSKKKVDEIFSSGQETLIDRRNESWIKPLTEAAEAAMVTGDGIVVAFGALHLPGEHGVLRLLEKDGWTIERIE